MKKFCKRCGERWDFRPKYCYSCREEIRQDALNSSKNNKYYIKRYGMSKEEYEKSKGLSN